MKIEFNQHVFSKKQVMVEGNSASDKRSGKMISHIFSLFLIMQEAGILVQRYRNFVMLY